MKKSQNILEECYVPLPKIEFLGKFIKKIIGESVKVKTSIAFINSHLKRFSLKQETLIRDTTTNIYSRTDQQQAVLVMFQLKYMHFIL